MPKTFIMPGSFCPPTYGHLEVVRQAAETYPRLSIICSVNPKKDSPWFTPAECVAMWRTYPLPGNVTVETLEQFLARALNPKNIVFVRGIRDESDFADEKEVMKFNFEHYGISHFSQIWTNKSFAHVSSSAARQAAEALDLLNLHDLVSPGVVSRLLEKTLNIKNLFVVVGPPGGGKSTFLKLLSAGRDDICFIDTDEAISRELRPMLLERFPGQDLINLALWMEEDFCSVITQPWFFHLKTALCAVNPGSTVFVEVPYGMREQVRIYQSLGAKIIYVGCEDRLELLRRNANRPKDARVAEFIDVIPDRDATRRIAERELLDVLYIDTNCPEEALGQKVKEFAFVMEHAWKTPRSTSPA